MADLVLRNDLVLVGGLVGFALALLPVGVLRKGEKVKLLGFGALDGVDRLFQTGT